MTRILKLILANAAITLALFLLVEGLASVLLTAHGMFKRNPPAERRHTEYDAELGWVNLPNLFVEDMYGPGVNLTTNAQRYRNRRNFGPDVPAGKIRIVCSGDSFTLGYGVGDHETWCHKLTELDERLETVNMGQGGYGVGQAYLWYMRNESTLNHDVHVFAFITDDFRRMQSDTFRGYGKPRLALRDGELVQENSPVPRRAYYVPWLTSAMQKLANLRTIRLLTRLAQGTARTDQGRLDAGPRDSARAVASKIFADLRDASQARARRFVLVYLPTLDDYMGLDPDTRQWRAFVKAEADAHGYLFVDVVSELRSVDPTHVKTLFRGHYSVAGNDYVADVLYGRLAETSVL
jgi:hypothetical protein